MSKRIYTHDEAMLIVEAFEELLFEHNVRIPSPEDGDREPGDLGLYGGTYSNLLDDVENRVVEILDRHQPDTKVIQDEFSGSV